MTLRGEGSLSYNNNTALFVVDGVPIGSGMDSNSSSGSYESNDAPIDYGNGAGDINPDDVESISVLKGPAGHGSLRIARGQRRRHHHHQVGPQAEGAGRDVHDLGDLRQGGLLARFPV